MNYYNILRNWLFYLPEEVAHNMAIFALKNNLLPKRKIEIKNQNLLKTNFLGLDFAHPIGLAAGFDKNGEAINGLFNQGFSFVEVGTVTPKPQSGNDKPRLFRLSEDEAIINRLGFNNSGVVELVHKVSGLKKRAGILGINIGKNKITSEESATDDYKYCLQEVYGHADYITINISSPNTPGLRNLQNKENLDGLLSEIKKSADKMEKSHKKKVPILVKLSPDMNDSQLKEAVDIILQNNIDGIIVSNTTIGQREKLRNRANADQTGGLSGKPLFSPSTEALRKVYKFSEGKIPLIGVGGVSSGADAYAKIRAGASLVQIYTCLIYQGFSAINKITSELSSLLERDGFTSISDAVGVDSRN